MLCNSAKRKVIVVFTASYRTTQWHFLTSSSLQFVRLPIIDPTEQLRGSSTGRDMEASESAAVTALKPDETRPPAWGGCRLAPPCSLNDVMSETLAEQLEVNDLQEAQRRT